MTDLVCGPEDQSVCPSSLDAFQIRTRNIGYVLITRRLRDIRGCNRSRAPPLDGPTSCTPRLLNRALGATWLSAKGGSLLTPIKATNSGRAHRCEDNWGPQASPSAGAGVQRGPLWPARARSSEKGQTTQRLLIGCTTAMSSIYSSTEARFSRSRQLGCRRISTCPRKQLSWAF